MTPLAGLPRAVRVPRAAGPSAGPRPPGAPLVASAAGRGLLGAGALVGAVGLGATLALYPAAGLALVLAGVFAAALWFDLRLAIALWVPVVFLEGVPLLNEAGKAAGALLALGWLVSVARVRPGATVRAQPVVFTAGALLGVWLALTVTWAEDVGVAAAALGQWAAVGLVFLVASTAMAGREAATLAAAAFVAGAVLSVLVGAAAPGLGTAEEGRFQGTAGDPNLLAAGAVPAVALALGLAAHRRGGGASPRAAAVALAGAVAVLAVAFVASGSRGGLMGAAASVAVALVVFPRRRAALLASTALALVVVAASVVLVPSAWERSSSVGSGSGRGDLWTVAWHMAGDHPVGGVGLDNYPEVAGDYARRVGPLQGVDIIAAEPHEAHNLYLQLLAEAGAVGLALFAVFAGGCLRSAWVAARRFAAAGDHAGATLARAVLVGGVGMLAAAFFVSAAVDRRLWLLLALGPALRAAATGAGSPVGARVSPTSAGR